MDGDRRLAGRPASTWRAKTTSAATTTQAHQRWRKWSRNGSLVSAKPTPAAPVEPSGIERPCISGQSLATWPALRPATQAPSSSWTNRMATASRRRRGQARRARLRRRASRRRSSAVQISAARMTSASSRCADRRKWLTSVRSARPGLDHVPAERALRAAEQQQGDQPPAVAVRDRALPREPGQRQREGEADQPAEQPVHPFPEEDELEVGEVHAGRAVDLPIFRRLLVEIEGALPVGSRQAAGSRR